MNNQNGSSKMDTILKMLMIVFVSLLAFSMGVYFGKEFTKSDYALKNLESDFTSQTKVAAAKMEHPEDAISDDEVASLSEKYLNDEKSAEHGNREVASENEHHDAHGDTKAATHGATKSAVKAEASHHETKAVGAHEPAHHAPAAANDKHDDHAVAPAAAKHDDHGKAAKPDLSAVHKAAARVAHNASPVETVHAPVVETRIPSSLPKTVGAKSVVEFTVQVASYPTADAAKVHAEKLVKKGLPAFPVEATVNGRTWYRVSVGSFKTMKEATGFRAQVLKQADVASAIVQKIKR